MSLRVALQHASREKGLPTDEDFQRWAQAALRPESAEVVIRIVDEEESRQLNRDYRGRDKPTNVLSFPFEAPPEVAMEHLGDLVICAPVVAEEAAWQGKLLQHHWAHMVVHGMLHLQGYDHQNQEEAEQMESLEQKLLEDMGIPDPYRETV
ncbi:MAG TPA: rRNA maturation RNase YbeY [Chromatiaceae bacterium]|nr:rRNA maturation RNase YbeY [Chromatiaceae bacterium]